MIKICVNHTLVAWKDIQIAWVVKNVNDDEEMKMKRWRNGINEIIVSGELFAFGKSGMAKI